MSRILLIEQDGKIREELERLIAQDGSEIITTDEVQKGIDAYEERKSEIIIVGHSMPRINSIEILKHARGREREVEVIVMVDGSDRESALEALRHDASDVIEKPVTRESLEIAIRRAEERLKINDQCRTNASDIERLQKDLTEQERRRAVGETVSGMAHFVKNILNGLEAGVYMVNTSFKRDKPELLSKGWKIVQTNVNKVSDLVMNMLIYTREREPEFEFCSPSDIVDEVVEQLEERAEDLNLDLVQEFHSEMNECSLDLKVAQRCLLNVCNFVIDRMGLKDKKDKSFSMTIRTAQNEQGTTFEVVAGGLDLSEEFKGKSLDEFCSDGLKKGTFGLLVAHQLIEDSGGVVAVEPGPNRDSVIRIVLPTEPSI